MNISDLGKSEIEKFGEHVSLIFNEREYTNVEMRNLSNRLGNALKKLGVGRGDRVIIQMPNCPEVLMGFQAVWKIGAVVVPINFLVGEEETAFIYKDSGAETIISSMIYWPKIEACRKGVPGIKNILLVDDDVPEGAHSFYRLLDESEDELEIVQTDDDEMAALIYTSGTTGRPRGVMHTHHTLYSNAVMQNDTIQLPSGLTGVSVLPMCHSYGIANMIGGYLVGGGRIVLLDSFDIDKLFAAIEKYKGNIVGAVPTMYIFMLLHPDPKKYDLSSMKYWVSGSAPLTLETWKRFRDTFGFEIIEGWGLTEAGANNSVNPFEGIKKVGSIGLPMKGTEMRIVDNDGNDVKSGESGEIIIRGPMLMKGYWNQPEATAEAIRDGWLYTGDVGFMDEDGYIFITDRKKDLIIKAGENITPREIEEVIFSHPKVSEASVIGIKDEIYGEDIKAFIVLKPDLTATPDEIIDHCSKILANFKLPREVEFLDKLPKNLVGKVLKKELRKREGL